MNSESQTLAPMLQKLSHWSALDEGEQRAVLGLPHSVRTVQRGDFIVREGASPTHSCLLIGGFAYRQKLTGDGGRQILAVHVKGDLVDLQNSLLRYADHSVQALTAASIAMIPVDAVREVAFAHPAVGLAMWYDTLVDASAHREWIANIGRRDAPARLSHLLCEFGVRLEAAGVGDCSHYELPMTQEELADSLGLTPVHINRTIMALERQGLITRTGRSVVIEDWNKLAQLGDFSPDYLHLNAERLTKSVWAGHRDS